MPRTADKDIYIGEFPVKKGTIVNAMFMYPYFNSKYFENPKEFDITRWENTKLKDSFCFLPFSAGGRHCIGQHLAIIEAKIFLTYVILKYELKLKS